MHVDEVHIDDALVRKLVEEQFASLADLPISAVPSAGTNNAMYRLGDELAVRLPRLDRAVKQIESDSAWLPRLAPLLSLAIPAPLEVGSPGFGYPYPWGVYRWQEGDTPMVGALPTPARFTTMLASFVTSLHAVRLENGPVARRGVALVTQEEATRQAIEQVSEEFDPSRLTAAWERAIAAPIWNDQPKWIHGDLGPGNVLVHGRKLSAVIDFGGVGMGDPAVDAIPAWNLLPRSARRTYRDALSFDVDTWERGRGWALTISLLQLPYYRDSNPILAENSRHVIREILDEADQVV